MSSEPRIKTKGTILANGTGNTFVAALPNGKEVIAFPSKDLAAKVHSLSPGSIVTLELTVYDFSKAKISSLDTC